MATWPAKTNYATGDVLSAANMNAIGEELNDLYTNPPAATNSYYAGKNKIINGDFGVWQRGTSTSVSASSYGYGADRWGSYAGTGAALTLSRQTFTPGAAPVSGYESNYFFRYNRTTTGSAESYLFQRIEDVTTFAGQTITISFWAKVGTGVSFTTGDIYLEQDFGTGGSSTVTTNVNTSTQAITTSWVRYSFTVAVPSISGKTIGTSSNLSLVFRFPTTFSTFTFDLWGVQVEAGSVATPFQTATGTKQGELAACQRYYYRISTDTNYNLFAAGNASSTTNAYIQLVHPVALRVKASSVEYSNLGVGFVGGTVNAVTNLVLDSASASTLRQNLTTTVASGLTANNYYTLIGNNSSSAYLGISAEL